MNLTGSHRWMRHVGRHFFVLEVSWGYPALGFKVSTRGEETLDIALRLGLVTLYANANLRRAADGRDVRLPAARMDVHAYWMEYDLWASVDLGEYDRAYGRGCRSWKWNSWKLKDRLLGAQVCTVTEVGRCYSTVPLPEGGVPCEIVWERREWKRPRWKKLSRLSADVTPAAAIDGTWSLCGPVKHVSESEAVLMLTRSVLCRRERKNRPIPPLDPKDT